MPAITSFTSVVDWYTTETFADIETGVLELAIYADTTNWTVY